MTGVSERSQQRGSLKDNGYSLILMTGAHNFVGANNSERVINRA
ncbi:MULTISPECIES: hypothetical protein [Photorhabdus]|nr:hypothetical protein [Photorhabdus asymbiotica]